MPTSFQTHYRCGLSRFVRPITILLLAFPFGLLAKAGSLPPSSLRGVVSASSTIDAPATRAVSAGLPWTAATAVPASVARYAFAQNGEDFYVISGISGGPNTTNVWRYNATTNIWTKRASIPVASEAPAAAFFGGKIYVATGDNPPSAFFIYDVATDTWSSGPARPGPVNSFGAAAGAFNGKIYIVGGGSTGPTQTVSIYTIATNSWSAGPPAPTAVQLAGYTQVGQYLYVIGGFTSTPTPNSTASMRLDMASNTWTNGPPFTPQRGDFGLAAAGTKLIAIGGDANGSDFFDPTALVDELDTTTWPSGTWVGSPDNLPTIRQGNSAGFISNGRAGGEIWTTGGATVGFISEHLFRAAPICLTYNYSSPTSGAIVPGTVDTGNHTDDGSTVIMLPFPYRLYDTEFTNVAVGSNGHLTFGTVNNSFNLPCIPVAGATYAIGPYWTDQCTANCTGVINPNLGIFTSVSGVAPNRIFNIEWRTVYYNSGGAGVPLNYEVRLYERQTSFDVIYGTVNTFSPPDPRKLSTGLQKDTAQFTQQGCDTTGGTAPPVSSGQLYHYTLTSTNCAPPPSPSGFLYVLQALNGGNNQIFGYGVNETTGVLTPLSGFPLNTGGTGSAFSFRETLRADPVNQRLYAINDGSDTVSAFAINPGTGALTPMPFSPITLGAGIWGSLAIHPTGSPLVVSQFSGSSGVKSFNIASSSVGEAVGSPFAGTSASSSSFSRDGSYCYEGGSDGALFSGFSVNPGNGVLTALAGSPFNAGVNNPYAYATDSQGRLFSATNGSSNLLAFTTASGIPSAVTGNPFASGIANAVSGLLHPNEQYYLAVSSGSPSSLIGSYRIGGSGAGTTLTPVTGSPFSVPGFRRDLALNQTGAFLFNCEFNGEVSSYPLNPNTGVLGNAVVPSVTAAGVAVSLAYTNPSMVRTAVSRKTHGAAGVFDINLPLTGTPGVECRNGSGAGLNDHQIVVSCVSRVVSLTDILVVSGSITGGSVGTSGNVITLNLTGVANAQRMILEFRGVSDGVNTGNFTLPINFLVGDTSGNGSVNASDVSQTKIQSGQLVTGSNFRNDVTVNGSINASDVSQVKIRSGTALP